ncbi:YIEGIA domain-containing protein [Metabacillus halosaccharovorans]|uniref:YIEGIA domain-containing protein n=1 Tax=Metabacillus halosaccharovorans TaxID=930124 RepID=UPI0020A82A9F|nr:YIEGIA domain-containing protein [Metabacillus halosaccharovorans]
MISTDQIVLILTANIVGTLARVFTIKEDYRQYPSYPNGYTSFNGLCSCCFGCSCYSSLNNKKFCCSNFLNPCNSAIQGRSED